MLYVLIQTGFCLCNHSQCQRGEMLAPALPTCIADISQHPYNSKATEHSNTHTMHAIYLLRIVWLHDINGAHVDHALPRWQIAVLLAAGDVNRKGACHLFGLF